jgi:hypothetical protein
MKKARLVGIAKSMIDPASNKRCHHFSFIIKKNRIMCIGQNNRKTHPVNLINRKVSFKTGVDFSEEKHTCSEFNAILKLRNLTNINTKKCELVNLRINKKNNLDYAKPCMSCENLLKYFEFKNVSWTSQTGEFVEK